MPPSSCTVQIIDKIYRQRLLFGSLSKCRSTLASSRWKSIKCVSAIFELSNYRSVGRSSVHWQNILSCAPLCQCLLTECNTKLHSSLLVNGDASKTFSPCFKCMNEVKMRMKAIGERLWINYRACWHVFNAMHDFSSRLVVLTVYISNGSFTLFSLWRRVCFFISLLSMYVFLSFWRSLGTKVDLVALVGEQKSN